jgi:proteic killer suppression protein
LLKLRLGLPVPSSWPLPFAAWQPIPDTRDLFFLVRCPGEGLWTWQKRGNEGKAITPFTPPSTLDVVRFTWYASRVIRSFRSKETEDLFHYQHSRRFSAFERVALRKLLQLHAATELKVLASPPGNRLEALSGDRKGQHSIRINEQWRICFEWREGHAHGVEITDYH